MSVNLGPNGASFKLGAVTIPKMYLGSVLVFSSSTAPSEITDFEALEGIGFITIDFTPATGDPTPTHNLYESGILVASGVLPLDEHYVSAGTREYYLMAVNSAGSEQSNIVYGTSLSTSGSVTIDYADWTEEGSVPAGTVVKTADGSFTFNPPEGVAVVRVCGGGAGGSGAAGNWVYWPTAGSAGEELTQDFSCTYGVPKTVTIGKGGAAVSVTAQGATVDPGNDGLPGSSSSFDGVSVAGGTPGTLQGTSFEGNGEAVEYCGGIFTNGRGYQDLLIWGGEAGPKGNGGTGFFSDDNGTKPDIHAFPGDPTGGGGGMNVVTFGQSAPGNVGWSGYGGDGRMTVSWD